MPVPRPASEDEALLLMIEWVARDPSFDLDRLERLFAPGPHELAGVLMPRAYRALADIA